jgi:SPP1 gp7 family putative phage head morphogenesis protein
MAVMEEEIILTSSDGLVEVDEEILAKLTKRRNFERTAAEQRVDFERLRRVYDEDAVALGLRLRGYLVEARDDLLDLFERQENNLTADFAQSIRIDVGREFSRDVEAYLMDVWRRNRDWALTELPEEVQGQLRGLQRYASSFRPDVAGNYFRNRALMIKGIVDDELIRQVKLQVFEHLKGGRTQAETMGYLWELFVPWISDPAKIEPSGLTRSPEDLLQAYRLENIVRTETTTAMSQGRAAVADAAGDFVLGYQLSAILDDRTTEQCQWADGLTFRKNDPRAIKLEPPLHYQCRTVLVFVTTNDQPIRWSTAAQLDRVVRLTPQGFK